MLFNKSVDDNIYIPHWGWSALAKEGQTYLQDLALNNLQRLICNETQPTIQVY